MRSLSKIRPLFAENQANNSFKWVSAMKGTSSHLETLSLYSDMRRAGVFPNSFICLLALKSCNALGQQTLLILQLHSQFLRIGLHCHLYVGTAFVNAYASCGRVKDAHKMFDEMPKRNTVTWNTLITGYSKCGDLETASSIFATMPNRNVESWSAMISAHMGVGRCQESLGFFREMQLAGVNPDKVALINALSACAQLGSLWLGMWIHAYIQRNGFVVQVELGTALIDVYGKCGFLCGAQQVFALMPKKNVMTWSAMISRLAMHGYGTEALALLETMEFSGVRPNEFTFTGVLGACSHAGLVCEGRHYFQCMGKRYGVMPKIEHYGCMVDLLSRAGLLDEAYEMVKSMKIKPNIVVWGALLGGCKVHKHVELGEPIIEQILQQKLAKIEDGGVYVLIYNTYASFGKWKDAQGVPELMETTRIKNTPGSSLIEVGEMVHEFVVADKEHPQQKEIYKMPDDIFQRLEPVGHKANTSPVLYDLQDEEKEYTIRYHSEKLAVSFGLLSFAPKITIRIVKNLRICVDCHSFMKSVSEVFGREIVVRDRTRFHHFNQGSCSCKDYW